jgi:hypothetical protein
MRAVAIGVAVVALAVAFAGRPHAVDLRHGPAAPRGADAARFAGAHLPDAIVRVARLPEVDALVAVADRAPGPDRSWGSSLLYAAPGRDAVAVVDRVFYASRPLVLPTGEVIVERGRAGATTPGRVRVDELWLDAVDPRSGAVRTIYRTSGFEAYLCGLAGDEALVYLIQPGIASLRAIDWRSGRERVVVPDLPPFAHDFVIDGTSVLVHNRDDQYRHVETVERIDLATGRRTRLETLTR